MQRFPTLFLSHGSPMHALDPGGAGKAWRAIADSLPKPRTRGDNGHQAGSQKGKPARARPKRRNTAAGRLCHSVRRARPAIRLIGHVARPRFPRHCHAHVVVSDFPGR